MSNEMTLDKAKNITFSSGKHWGKTVSAVFKIDPEYLDRIYDSIDGSSVLSKAIAIVCYKPLTEKS